MKVGCAVWVFSPMDRPSSDEEAIRTIGQIGFDGLELILRTRAEFETYWTPDQIARIQDLYRSQNLTLSQFVIRWEVVAGFASLDPEARERSLEYFERGCELAKVLGTDTICTISPWPTDLRVPSASPPNYWHVSAPGWDKPKLRLQFPDPFDWDANWGVYVESIRRVTAIARASSLRFALENHTNAMSPHTDSLLRLFDNVGDSALGANFDVGFAFIQRESIPWAIYKLKDRLFHMHVRDGDGLSDYLRPVGSGILDWEGIVRALKQVDFGGFISLEWPRYPENQRFARESLDHLREQIARLSA